MNHFVHDLHDLCLSNLWDERWCLCPWLWSSSREWPTSPVPRIWWSRTAPSAWAQPLEDKKRDKCRILKCHYHHFRSRSSLRYVDQIEIIENEFRIEKVYYIHGSEPAEMIWAEEYGKKGVTWTKTVGTPGPPWGTEGGTRTDWLIDWLIDWLLFDLFFFSSSEMGRVSDRSTEPFFPCRYAHTYWGVTGTIYKSWEWTWFIRLGFMAWRLAILQLWLLMVAAMLNDANRIVDAVTWWLTNVILHINSIADMHMSIILMLDVFHWKCPLKN